jgi:hypothetical protein
MTISLLHRKILSIAEQKMGNLRGLRGLKVRELRKFGGKSHGMMSQKESSSLASAVDSQIAIFEKSLDFI